MKLRANKGLRESFRIFLDVAGIDIGFVFLQRIQGGRNDLQILTSSNPREVKSIENKLTKIGKSWIENLNSEQNKPNYRSKRNMFDVDYSKASTRYHRLMCTVIEYSNEIKGYLFWGFKSPKKVNLNKTNNLCRVFGNFMIAYFEQEALLQASKSTEKLSRYIIDNSPDQIFIKDKNFKFTFSNKSHYQAQKLKRSEVIGKTNYDLGFSKEQIEGDRSKGITGFLRDDKNAMAGNKTHNRFDPVTISDGSIRVHDTYKIPFYENGKIIGVLGYARDITNWHDDIVERTKSLNEKTTALKVFLEQRDEEKNEIAKNISINIEKFIIPYLDKLKIGILTNQQQTIIEIIETNLCNILRPFARKLSSTHYKLSPTELQVANLIKEGKSTQEIADVFCLAVGTITTHRANIRKKLGLRNSKVNLRTYLDNI